MSSETRSKPRLHILQLASAFFGIALSLYLLAQHTRLKSGIQGGSSFCSFGPHADCDLVNSSRFSEIFGIPLAGVGAVYFFCLLLLVVVTPRKSSAGVPASQVWITRLCALAIGADSVLVVVQIFYIQSVCLLCFLTYAANLGLFLSALALRGGGWGNALKEALSGEPPGEPLPSKGPLPVVLGISLVLFTVMVGFIPNLIRLTSKDYALVNSAIEQFFSSWPEKKVKVIDWREGDGTQGNPNAPIRIVEFSDFQCPFCRNAAFTLHTALEPFKDQVFFVFKHFPLDPSCNPFVQYQVHPNACHLAKLAHCAQKKGKFWEFHDLVFLKLSQEAVNTGPSALTPALDLILTKQEVANCVNDPAAADAIVADARLGRSLDLKGTPAVYVNGKPVTIPLTIENVGRLIALELSLQRKPSP